ncbi:hypothetical protein D3C81_2195250 [compost metagenome]
MDAGSFGSNSASSRPMTSGTLVVPEPMVGAPQAMASNAGRPNPSCSDGNTNAAVALYSAISSSSVM